MKLNELHEGRFKDMAAAGAIGLGIGAAGMHSYLDQSQSTKGPEKTVPVQAQPAQPHPKLQAQPKPQAQPKSTKYFADYIGRSEGFKNKVYDDGRGNLTIGVGHMLKPESEAIFKKLFGDSVDFKAIASGKQSLTDDQVVALFSVDLEEHLDRAKRRFPSFDSYPLYLQAALLDSVYRGDTGNKTTALINAGKWQAAAKEYLNRRDYKNRVALGIRGIGPRMERNRDAMLKYASEIKTAAQPR